MVDAAIPYTIVGPIIFGLLGSLLELAFVHSDEGIGMHWIAHGLHAVPFCFVFAFISMNYNFILQFVPVPFLRGNVAEIVVSVLIFFIATLKVKAAAAIVQGHGSVGEKLPHAMAVGLILAGAPWVWPFIIPMLPNLPIK